MVTNLISTAARQVYGLYSSKSTADEIYINLLPAIYLAVRTKGRHSTEAIGLFNILESLPSFGAKRNNFKKHYIDIDNGWKKLPSNPSQIPFGFWH